MLEHFKKDYRFHNQTLKFYLEFSLTAFLKLLGVFLVGELIFISLYVFHFTKDIYLHELVDGVHGRNLK